MAKTLAPGVGSTPPDRPVPATPRPLAQRPVRWPFLMSMLDDQALTRLATALLLERARSARPATPG